MTTPIAATTEGELPTAPRERYWWVEHVAIVVLAVTSILTAWSAYQSTRWNGEQATAFGIANSRRAESVRVSTAAGQAAIIDAQSFVAWSEAIATRDTELAVFFRERFRPEFRAAFDAWLNRPPGETLGPDEVPSGTPFDTYRPAAFVEAERLAVEADAAFEEAKIDNQRSDNYVLTAVIFAGVLFFGGVAPRFRSHKLGAILIGLACVVMFGGIIGLAFQPISFSL